MPLKRLANKELSRPLASTHLHTVSQMNLLQKYHPTRSTIKSTGAFPIVGRTIELAAEQGLRHTTPTPKAKAPNLNRQSSSVTDVFENVDALLSERPQGDAKMNACQNCRHAIDHRHTLESIINTLQQQLAEKEEEISGLQTQIQNGFQLGREFEREKLGREQARLDQLELRQEFEREKRRREQARLDLEVHRLLLCREHPAERKPSWSPTIVFDFPGEAVSDPSVEEDKPPIEEVSISSKSASALEEKLVEDKSVEDKSVEESLNVLRCPDVEPAIHEKAPESNERLLLPGPNECEPTAHDAPMDDEEDEFALHDIDKRRRDSKASSADMSSSLSSNEDDDDYCLPRGYLDMRKLAEDKAKLAEDEGAPWRQLARRSKVPPVVYLSRENSTEERIDRSSAPSPSFDLAMASLDRSARTINELTSSLRSMSPAVWDDKVDDDEKEDMNIREEINHQNEVIDHLSRAEDSSFNLATSTAKSDDIANDGCSAAFALTYLQDRKEERVMHFNDLIAKGDWKGAVAVAAGRCQPEE